MSKHALGNLSKMGFHKTFRAIFPVRKEAGEVWHESRLDIARKIRFDLGITSFRSVGDFDIQTAGAPETIASGVTVLQIAKDIQGLIWLKLGERCYDVEIKLGEHRVVIEEAEVVTYKDYSHVTEEMIHRALPKFLGRTTQKIMHPAYSEGFQSKHIGICHEIRVQAFEPPIVRMHIRCGLGFWPKNFVHELAEELGTVCHPTKLHRISQGPFTYEEALPSYAISWENCTKASDKYADRLRAYNREVKSIVSESDLEAFLSEKRLYKLFGDRNRTKKRAGESDDVKAPIESHEAV